MASKIYRVQTWNPNGSVRDRYDVTIGHPSQLTDLKKFLKTKVKHFVISSKPKR